MSTTPAITVLGVDDSRTIRRVFEAVFCQVGCHVVTACDGFSALAIVADQQPDLIVMDIMMPRLNGYDTCALIKNNHSLKHTPVILSSSKSSVFDQAKGRLVGCDGYLVKPFSRQDLLQTLHLIQGI